MFFQKFHMRFRVVSHAACRITVGGIALYYVSIDCLYHGPPEFRPQKVLIALFTGMDLYGHFSWQVNASARYMSTTFSGVISLEKYTFDFIVTHLLLADLLHDSFRYLSSA